MSGSVLLGMYACNRDSIWTCVIVLLLMVFSIFLLQLFVYAELYQTGEECLPILFYFGEKTACKRMMDRNAKYLVNYSNIQSTLNNDIIYDDVHSGSESFVSSSPSSWVLGCMTTIDEQIQRLREVHDCALRDFVYPLWYRVLP